MRKNMCRQDVALEMLKAQPRKGGLSSGQIKLAEAQAADFKSQKGEIKMLGERMTNVEKELRVIKEEQQVIKEEQKRGFEELKRLIIEQSKPRTLFEKIVALQEHKYFWITLIVALIILGALFGVPVTGFNGILNIGG